MNNKKKFILKYFEVYLIVILLYFDYLGKYYANKLFISDKINLLSDYIYLELHKNNGIAFSIQLPFLKIITVLIILFLVYYYIKYEKCRKNKLLNISYILIISGALGNAWERILFGKVTDFIGIKYFSVFNFADIYINIGIILYLLIIVLKKDNKCVK